MEAGTQLAECEFFGEDHPIRITGTSATFGPTTQLLAVLAPFRRMWMQNEVSNFNLAAIIVERNSSNQLRKLMAIQQRDFFNKHKLLKTEKTGLSYTDVIDLWLYTQFAHCQTKRTKRQRFIREDFDRWVSKVGKAQLEYDFRSAIKLLGMHFLIFYQDAALPELIEWKNERNIVIPFEAKNAFSSDSTEVCDDGGVIQRRSHGLLATEPPSYRLVRLLERQRFYITRSLFDVVFDLRCPNPTIQRYERVCDAIQSNETSQELLAHMGYAEDIGCSDAAFSQHAFYDFASEQKGSIKIFPNKCIGFGDDGAAIIGREYTKLRDELFNGKNSSTFSDVTERLKEELALRQTLKEIKKVNL